jgi:hypothetical protein
MYGDLADIWKYRRETHITAAQGQQRSTSQRMMMTLLKDHILQELMSTDNILLRSVHRLDEVSTCHHDESRNRHCTGDHQLCFAYVH